MASVGGKKSCVKCSKGLGQVLCDGCEQYFCVKHLLEHRQELGQQMDALTLEHDQLRQTLTGEQKDDQEHPLFTRVDHWETQSIQRIEQVANEVRSQLREFFSETTRHVVESLGRVTHELQEHRELETFTEMDLHKWMSQLRDLRMQLEDPTAIAMVHDQDEPTSSHIPLIQIRTTQRINGPLVPPHITDQTRWSSKGQTVAGSHGRGEGLHQLHSPMDLDVDDDGSLFIADAENHRILRWQANAAQGEIVAGGNGRGDRTDQLNLPVAVLIDRINRSLIVTDQGNRRLMRWSLDPEKQNSGEGEVIMSDVLSFGLAMDEDGALYVSDAEKHEVRRYGRKDGRDGVIVVGGNGQGDAVHQLSRPRQIFVAADHSVYVSDGENPCVMKWAREAREGVIVGGDGQWRNLAGLNSPSGIFVDRMGSIYVVDQGNYRVLRLAKDANDGEVLFGGNGRGSRNNQLNQPTSIAMDGQGNLYVADSDNHRIQRFDLERTPDKSGSNDDIKLTMKKLSKKVKKSMGFARFFDEK